MFLIVHFCSQGMQYFFDRGLVQDRPSEIAKFFHSTSKLSKSGMRQYLQNRSEIVDFMFTMQNYENQSLANALRRCFAKLEAPPNDRGRYLQELLDCFSKRFCQCNPKLGYSPGMENRTVPIQKPAFEMTPSSRFSIRPVLLLDPPLCGPDFPSRQEQDVEAGVHPQHTQRRPPEIQGRAGRLLRRDVRQRLPPRPRFRRGKGPPEATAPVRAGIPGNVPLKKTRLPSNAADTESAEGENRRESA